MKDKYMHPVSPAMDRRRWLQGALATAGAAATGLGHASAWPSKPVRLIVGFPAGTSPDFLARVFSDPLSQALGQPVIVENKPGATGTIGVDAVARSTDGHTLGLTGNGPLTTAKLLNPKVPFDVARDLRPVSLIADSPFVLTGSTRLPDGDLAAVMAYARTQGDKLTYGSIGPGSGSHLAMELLKSQGRFNALHVPFPGFPQVANAMVGGQVDFGFMVPSVAVPLAQAGRLRILGVSTAVRSAVVPDIPTIAQALNLPGFDIAGWNAVFGPASLPREHADRVSQEIARLARTPAIREQLFNQGWKSLGTSPEALHLRIKDDTQLWASIIRSTNTRVE